MRGSTHRWLLVTAAVLAACTDTPVAGPDDPPLPDASLAADAADDRYIVVFDDRVGAPDELTDQLVRAFGGTVHFRYLHALKGFAATLPEAALDGIGRNPSVRYIEPDGIATVDGDQNAPSWGLNRIDENDLPMDGFYHWDFDGTGVRAYILDTGIRTDHVDFGGRASVGYDAIGDGKNGQDCHGHGTHVAGTVGGTNYGVAKNVALVAVRVLNCSGSGSWSQVIAGIDWVTGDHDAGEHAVANMSLGGGLSQSVNDAVARSVADGVTYAVAAGNSNANACNYSPASAPSALTVGSTTSTDARSSFSSWGTCLDLFAPGSSIVSDYYTSATATATMSGTSMASPHVAGVAALYLQANPGSSPAQVESGIEGIATAGKVTDPAGSPNLLLYSLVAAGAPLPPPPPPPPAPDPVATEIHSHDLDGTSWKTGKRGWKASATLLVHDGYHRPVEGVTMSGTWSGGYTGNGSCVTTSSGTCSMPTPTINNGAISTGFTLFGLSKAGLTYNDKENADPDGDSLPAGTAINIPRP
jgi:hypothetical protein